MTKLMNVWFTALGLVALVGCNEATSTEPASSEAKIDASEQTVDSDAIDILAGLRAARPNMEFGEPKPLPIDGLYNVQVIGGPTLYVDKSGKYFIAEGDLFAIEGDRLVNLQEKEREKERASLLAKVDPADQIIFSPEGETKAVVSVFTDIDCGYCQKLHREIEQINALGIEVRYMAYPRAGPQSPSADKLALAWCAEDRQAALTKLKNRQSVDGEVCEDNPVADQYRLGMLMGVNGTPNMVTSTGVMIGGYAPAAKLAEYLEITPPSAE